MRPLRQELFEIQGVAVTLIGGFSPSSGRRHFPLAPACPYTGADDVEPVRLPTTGRLWAWTAVTTAPAGYAGEVPYGFGVVELDDGLRVVGRLTESDPGRLTEGRRMRLVAVEAGVDDDGEPFAMWAFTPDDAP